MGNIINQNLYNFKENIATVTIPGRPFVGVTLGVHN